MARTILKSRRRVYLALASVGLLALIVVGTAYAITSSTFKYSSTKTGYVSVSNMAFNPDGPNGTGWFNSWGGGLTDTDGGSGCFNAGINLPQGAKIKSVTWFYESGAGSNFFGRLTRMDMPTATGLDLVPFVNPANDTGNPSSVTRNLVAANQTVNNSKYSYGIGACPGSDGVINGARVKYTYKTAGS